MLEEFVKKNKEISKVTEKEVVYNGFDDNEYYMPEKRMGIRKKWGVDKEFVLGMVGNFVEIKKISFQQPKINLDYYYNRSFHGD